MKLHPLSSQRRRCGLRILHTIAILVIVGSFTDLGMYVSAQSVTTPGYGSSYDSSSQKPAPDSSSNGMSSANGYGSGGDTKLDQKASSDGISSNNFGYGSGTDTSPVQKSSYGSSSNSNSNQSTSSRSTSSQSSYGQSSENQKSNGSQTIKKVYRPGKVIKKRVYGGKTVKKIFKPGKTIKKKIYGGKTVKKIYNPGKIIKKRIYGSKPAVKASSETNMEVDQNGNQEANQTSSSSESAGNAYRDKGQTTKKTYKPGKVIKKKVYGGKTVKKIYNPGKVIKKKIYGGKTVKKIYNPGKTIKKRVYGSKPAVKTSSETNMEIDQNRNQEANQTSSSSESAGNAYGDKGQTTKKTYKPGKVIKKKVYGGKTVKKIYNPGKVIKKKIYGGKTVKKTYNPGKTIKKRVYGSKPVEKNYTTGEPSKTDNVDGDQMVKKIYTPGKITKKRVYGGKTVKKVYNPGKTVKKVYNPGKTVKKVYSPGKTVNKKATGNQNTVMKKVYVPGKVVTTKQPYGPTYGYKKETVPGKTIYKKVKVPGETTLKKVSYEPKYDYQKVRIPGKTINRKIKIPGEITRKKVPVDGVYGQKKIYKGDDGDTDNEFGYKKVRVPGGFINKKIATSAEYKYEKVKVPGETHYKKVRIPGETTSQKVPTPAEYGTKKIRIPGKQIIKKDSSQTRTTSEKKYVPPQYDYKTVEIPGGYTSKKIIVPGKTVKRKVPYDAEYGVKTIYIDGEPVKTKVRIPGKTVVRKVRIPEEYDYKKVSVLGKTISKKVKVPGGTRKEKYEKNPSYKYEKRKIPGGTTTKKVRVPGRTITRKIRTDPRYVYKKVPVEGEVIKKKVPASGKTIKTKVPTEAQYKYVEYSVPGGTKAVKTRVNGKAVTEKTRIPGKYEYKTIKQIMPSNYKKIYVPGRTIVQKIPVSIGNTADVYLPPDQEYMEELYNEATGTYVHRLKHCTWNIDQKEYNCVIEKDSIDEYTRPEGIDSSYRTTSFEQPYVEEYYDEVTGSTRRHFRVCTWSSEAKATICRTEEIPVVPDSQPSQDPGTSITNVYLPPDRVYTEEYLDKTTNTVRKKLRICSWNVADKRYICSNKNIEDVGVVNELMEEIIITEFINTWTGEINYQIRKCGLSSRNAERECTVDNGLASDGYKPLRPTNGVYNDQKDIERGEFANDIIRNNFRIETVYWPENSDTKQRIYIYEYIDKSSRKYKRRLMICRLDKRWECATSIDNTLNSPLDIVQVNPRDQKINNIKLEGPNEVENIHLSTDSSIPTERIYVQEYLDPITGGIQKKIKVCTLVKNLWECTTSDTGSTYGQLDQKDIAIDEEEIIDLYLESSSGKITRNTKMCKRQYKDQCENTVSEFGGYKPLIGNRSGHSSELSLYSGLQLQNVYWPEMDLNAPAPDRVYIYEFIDQTTKQVERRIVICRYDTSSQVWMYTTVPGEKLPNPIDFDNLENTSIDIDTVSLSSGNIREVLHFSHEKTSLPAERIYIQEYFEATAGFTRRRTKICTFDDKLQKWNWHNKDEELGGPDPFISTVELPSDRTYVDEYINTDTGGKSIKTTVCKYDMNKRDWFCTSNIRNTATTDLEADTEDSWSVRSADPNLNDSSWSEYIDTQEIYDPSSGATRTRSKLCKLHSNGKWKCTARKTNGNEFNEDSYSPFELSEDIDFESSDLVSNLNSFATDEEQDIDVDDDLSFEDGSESGTSTKYSLRAPLNTVDALTNGGKRDAYVIEGNAQSENTKPNPKAEHTEEKKANSSVSGKNMGVKSEARIGIPSRSTRIRVSSRPTRTRVPSKPKKIEEASKPQAKPVVESLRSSY